MTAVSSVRTHWAVAEKVAVEFRPPGQGVGPASVSTPVAISHKPGSCCSGRSWE